MSVSLKEKRMSCLSISQNTSSRRTSLNSLITPWKRFLTVQTSDTLSAWPQFRSKKVNLANPSLPTKTSSTWITQHSTATAKLVILTTSFRTSKMLWNSTRKLLESPTWPVRPFRTSSCSNVPVKFTLTLRCGRMLVLCSWCALRTITKHSLSSTSVSLISTSEWWTKLRKCLLTWTTWTPTTLKPGPTWP